jgi:iron complex outermembrane receptor protein
MTPFQNVKINLSARYNDRNGHFLQYDQSNDKYLDERAYKPFWLFNGAVKYFLNDWIFSLEATNLFNTNYHEMGNIEMPGRWLKIGVQRNFNL